MAVYRWSAQDSLTGSLARNHIPGGYSTRDVVRNPEDGVQLLRDRTDLGAQQVSQVYESLFTQGNQAAMWLLFATSAIALCVIGALGLRRTKAPEPGPAPAAAQPLHSERR